MARQPADIDPSSCFRVSPVPELGLKDTLEFPLRAYVLRCKGGKFYTGIHPAKDIQKRITEQFTAKRKHGASEFCETNPPLSVICVWPAIDHAVEAALFFALMGSLNCSDFRKLGGWVYTSAKPSPLAVMQLEQCRRQLSNKCFDCGETHYAGHPICRGPNQDCFYKCVHCQGVNNVSSRGQSRLHDKAALKEVAKITTENNGVRRAAPAPAVITVLRPTAQKTPARKRSVDVDFQSLWSSVRKKRRLGRSKELGSLADMIEQMIIQMHTAKAKAAKKHINDRIGPWSRRYNYSDPQDYQTEVEEFSSKTGGGMGGVGVSQDFASAIFKELSTA